MGQASSCNTVPFDANPYVDPPAITLEEVLQIRKCFEYLQPEAGVLDMGAVNNPRLKHFLYMEDVLEELQTRQQPVNFDAFFQVMKPKIAELKVMQGDSVVLENTSTNASCLFCPYVKNAKSGNGRQQFFQ